MTKKKWIGIIIAVAVLLAAYVFPAGEALSREGILSIALMVSFLSLLICDSLPLIISSLLIVSIMPAIGVTKGFGTALSGYSSPVVFFVLASFGLAAGFTQTPLSRRMLSALLKRFGGQVNRFMLVLMSCTALVSSLISNVPTCAIFMSIGMSFLDLYEDPIQRKQSGRAIMIGVPVASMIGGMMTPAGSSINILTINLLEQYTNQTIAFVKWMAIGIPLALVTLPLAWKIIVSICKPAQLPDEKLAQFANSMDFPKKTTIEERKYVTIMLIMIVLWILSSWVRSINLMVVALIGCCALFLPGIKVLNLEDFLRENNWDSFFLLGTIISLANVMITNGIADLIAQLMPAAAIPLPLLIPFTALLVFVSLLIVPVAPSMVTILAVPVIAIATNAGANPALFMIVLALCAGNCYLLPLDTVVLLTYGKGYYSATDLAKNTVFLQLFLAVLLGLWIPLFSGIL